jgi:ribosomal protein S18 acetylase RimI-like enzyme
MRQPAAKDGVGQLTRIAQPDDAPLLTPLLEAFDGPPISVEQVQQRLLAIQGIETVLLAEVEGQTVGFASLRVVPYLSDDVPRDELTELYVEAAYRRRGVGRALLERVEAMARERGATELVLLTGQGNQTAQAFYRAIGFRECALAMEKPLGGDEKET